MHELLIQSYTLPREQAFRLYELTLREHIESVYGWDETGQRERFETTYPNENLQALYLGADSAGLLALRDQADCLHVALLLIDPAFQGHGLGRRAMLQLQARGKDITLSCFKHNVGALRFYLGLGYTISGEDEHFYDLRRPAEQNQT